ncbi:MAG: dicarboxylate/amino acid:cation symporter [Caulobacteraceae bacterium]
MNRRFTLFILLGMVLGTLVGAACHAWLDPAAAKSAASGFALITDIFLRMIKMIIAPLVFSTLIAGVAHMGDSASIGRVGAKTLGWFLAASLASLCLGLFMATILHPGTYLHLTPPPAEAVAPAAAASLTLKDFISHVFPTSVVHALAENEILQIVVFSMFAGVAIAGLGPRTKSLLHLIEEVSTVMLKITEYVMKAAPFAVFAALAATVSTEGLAILASYAAFVGGFYLSLGVLWALLFAAAAAVVGKRAIELIRAVRQPTLLAFSTASSEAAYPGTLEGLELFGVPKRIASFVLPLGYSFNLDGSMIYTTFATLFIADTYGIALSWPQKFLMVAILMLTSKGIAGVPRASLVVIAATLSFFHIPEAGLLLILAVDHFLDMGRSATNVIGNSVAAVAVAKWEKSLTGPQTVAQVLTP